MDEGGGNLSEVESATHKVLAEPHRRGGLSLHYDDHHPKKDLNLIYDHPCIDVEPARAKALPAAEAWKRGRGKFVFAHGFGSRGILSWELGSVPG